MDELIIDGQVYVPSRRAAEITGYAKDYIGQLCREGRVEAKLVGRSWYVLETSLREHRFGGGEGPVVPAEEVTVTPEAVAEPEATDTWESPSYSAEEVPEIVPLSRPNYLENTADNLEEPTPEPAAPSVESAWQDWYAKSGKPEAAETEVSIAPEEAPEPVTEPELHEEPVQEEVRVPIKNIPGSMDIAPVHHVADVVEEAPQARVYETRKGTKPKRRSRGGGARVYKAIFTAYVMLVATVVIIGAGLLDSVPQNPVTDYIGGIDRLVIH